MADLVFDQIRYHIGLGFTWSSATVKGVLLSTAGYTPAVGDTYVQTLLTAGAVRVSSGGSANDQTIAAKATSLDSGGHRALWDGNDITYPSVPNATAYDMLVLYNFVTNDTDSWLMFAYALGAQTGTGSNIAITVNAAGYAKW